MNKKDSTRLIEIKNLILMISITLFIGIFLLIFYITRTKNQYIIYNDKANIDYKVYLKEDDSYNENKTRYMASLIKTIKTNFQYNLDFSLKAKYRYSYHVVAEVGVEDEKSASNIYHFSEDLVNKKLTVGEENLSIQEKLNIDYSHYNDLISKFKDTYDLNSTTSHLNLYLYVTVRDVNQSKKTILKDKKVSSLSIPLTENKVSIDIDDDTITSTNHKILIDSCDNYTWILVVSSFYLFVSLIYIVYLIIYARKSRTARMIYDKEIKSIMNNYDSSIQKINTYYDIGTSQILKIDSFNEMLEIHDTLKQPILMLENEDKNGTFFIIPATNSIIYTYALRVLDIQAKMDGREVPTYDITEIPQSKFKKKKKYTDKFIKDQITMTTSMPIIDENNVIKGNKDKTRDLYEQLEKTTSFDIREIRKAKKRARKSINKK